MLRTRKARTYFRFPREQEAQSPVLSLQCLAYRCMAPWNEAVSQMILRNLCGGMNHLWYAVRTFLFICGIGSRLQASRANFPSLAS